MMTLALAVAALLSLTGVLALAVLPVLRRSPLPKPRGRSVAFEAGAASR
jgi:hypothetical protein